MTQPIDIRQLLERAVFIWGQARVAQEMGVERETVNRWLNHGGIAHLARNKAYLKSLEQLVPAKPRRKSKFQFIDLFAGIGGIRRAFESIGGECVFTSEWDQQARRTYLANHYCPHPINSDIRDIKEVRQLKFTLGLIYHDLMEEEVRQYIDDQIPDHHVLLAGFPCQPFSIAGVTKKNALGRAHGFDCRIQGTLFFEICKILKAKRPACFMLENVKNLKSHNKGDTYQTILKELRALGYAVPEPRILNAQDYVPQHRERIVIVGFREDLEIHDLFDFDKVKPKRNAIVNKLGDILESNNEVDDKYTLTPKLWDYLFTYKQKHRSKGNGFGYDIFTPDATNTRTLSARYYKDGSEILIARSKAHAKRCEAGEDRPRRLTPRECARLMGFDGPCEANFRIPVSDTQAYKQFGNSVVVPVFEAVARQMRPAILLAAEKEQERFRYRKGEPIQQDLVMEQSAKFSIAAG
ncbi:MAG: DNA (cytosine-5-)-methyltransferase [Pseudomonadales bacterium]|nr:DNA (cytosine-5-)-methyltransferase [Pseudomonadales bacterium]